jgi:multiple antibiotic resistance protein
MDLGLTDVTFTLGKVFTFLFLTLGPFNVIGPFAAMTQGRDAAFKRRLAFEAIVISALALLVAAIQGARTLRNWGVSVGTLQLTGGIILFLVALRPVLKNYEAQEPREAEAAGVPSPSLSALAFTPLAFPTIVTPYGVALLVMALTLQPFTAGGFRILGVAGFVLILDLLVMLGSDRIQKIRFVPPALGIVGSVMGVLQIALGVQAAVDGLSRLGIV